jgi:hypothetical protein
MSPEILQKIQAGNFLDGLITKSYFLLLASCETAHACIYAQDLFGAHQLTDHLINDYLLHH